MDDAIERATSYFVVTPYKSLSESSKKSKCVFKVHGDVKHELIYSETNLIFSSVQYIRSLTKNIALLDYLKNDFLEKNVIFIGCSLAEEIDLVYSLTDLDEGYFKKTERIYVCRKKPEGLDLIDLEKYRISTVVVVDDFDEFYRMVASIFIANKGGPSNLKNFSSEKISVLASDHKKNIDYLLNSSLKGMGREYVLPNYVFQRDICKNVLSSLESRTITILKGRRFSGKSVMMKCMATSILSKPVFYFPSSCSINDDIVDLIMLEKNSVFLFDSNSLDIEMAIGFFKRIEVFKKNKCSALFSCNAYDNDLVNYFIRNAGDDVSFFMLENKFSALEVGLVNSKLSNIGLSQWNNRLTIINNIYRYHEVYSSMSLIYKYAEKISDTEFKLLIVIAVQDKTYSLVANVLGLSPRYVNELVEKVNPVIECADTDSAEYHEHSAKKVYANSKPWLFRIISEYYEIKGNHHVGSVLLATIKDLWARKELKVIAKSLTKFDALNELFGMKRSGVSGLILDLYKDLSSIMSSYDDYWLQRAKACLHMSNDKALLKEGIIFATKIINDDREFNVVLNARFILALLYSKLSFLEKYENEDNVIQAIYWIDMALKQSHRNIRYVNSMLENHKGKESWVMSLYNYLSSPNLPMKLLLERSKISVIAGYIEEYLRKKTDKNGDILKKSTRRGKRNRRRR